MAMTNCPKCWETPCACGHEYTGWSIKAITEHIQMLQRVAESKSNLTINKESADTSGLKEEINKLQQQLESKEEEILTLSSPERGVLHNPDGLTYNQPEHGWVCFHCGDTLMTFREAKAHFGETPETGVPRCKELLEENKDLKEKLRQLGHL